MPMRPISFVKKREFIDKGIVLRTNRKYKKSILTLNGSLDFYRYALLPKTDSDRKKLAEATGRTTIFPMDEYLGIGHLPFKMSVEAMLDVAFWAQNQSSFQRAEDVIMRVHGLKVNDDTVRKVTDAVGRHIFLLDKGMAADAMSRLDAGKLMFPESKKAGTLYLETDGAALNTRTKDNDGSTWKENKLGVAFSSDNIRYWTDAHGERQHQVLKREYTSFIGSSAEFGAHMFALAIRNGYGLYENTVILSDGATWIKQAGMRWNTATAQPLLTLIAKKESGLWACDVEVPIRALYSGK